MNTSSFFKAKHERLSPMRPKQLTWTFGYAEFALGEEMLK